MKLITKIWKYIWKSRRYLLFLIDAIVIIISYIALEVFIRDTIRVEVTIQILKTAIISIIVYQIVFHIFKLYKSLTRYESGKDYLIYILACIISGATVTLIKSTFMPELLGVKHNVAASIIIAMAMIGYRIIIRIILTDEKQVKIENQEQAKRLLIIGAGLATRDIIKSIKTYMKNMYNIVRNNR